ncbi:MAG: Rv3235 family protein [Actinomycetaceae bacterium]|nr:Rv3235 family protein [Actinomycetaceae bacterium]
MCPLEITSGDDGIRAIEHLHIREIAAQALPRSEQTSERWRLLPVSADFSGKHPSSEPVKELSAVPRKAYHFYGTPVDPGDPPLPDPLAWSGAIATASVEVLLGLRPYPQLSQWLAPQLRAVIERRLELNSRLIPDPGRQHRPRIVSSRACLITDDVAETTHVVRQGQGYRAVAVRLERFRRRWITTALEIV